MIDGKKMYSWASEMFPFCRSITGDGVRNTLEYIRKIVPQIKVCAIDSGTKVYDWIVPPEWNIKDAYVMGNHDERIIDFKKNNLHVVNYSEPIDKVVTFEELDQHLYSLPEKPDAIPYITSYYERKWGFCLTDNLRKKLKKYPQKKYHVKIDAAFKKGVMNYGELILDGKKADEILLSTYICHPSMANNEISGPCVAMALSHWLAHKKNREYTYRILFLPETIGAISYLYLNREVMKQRVKAGFVITCVGDDNSYSYVPSRYGDTLSDKVAKLILNEHTNNNYRKYSYLDRGSDERQFCSPGIDLPICSICRTKYNEYAEYHTSLDNMGFISSEGLSGALSVYKKCLSLIEANYRYNAQNYCEPFLSKYDLSTILNMKGKGISRRDILNVLAYADGSNDIINLCEHTKIESSSLIIILENLKNLGLITENSDILFCEQNKANKSVGTVI